MHRFQRGGVLGKGGGQHQRLPGLGGHHKPEDEVGCAVAAEDVGGGHALGRFQRRTQGAAEGVRVAVCRRERRHDGVGHPLRQAQRADVGRKIQRVVPESFAVAHPVTAMGQSLHKSLLQKSARRAHPHASAKLLATYIMRLARRISSGSMGRRASPMVSLG